MDENVKGREILIGVTGGIAAYKTAALVSRLSQAEARVTVVMTEAATRFVGTATFRALTGRPVAVSMWPETEQPLGPHIELGRRAELMCVAPASANFLAKAATGVADDLLSTLYLCFSGAILVAPAMNTEMWNKPAVQRNVRRVAEDGARLIGPGSGWLSCREEGAGRMSEPDEIFAAIVETLTG